MQFYFLRHAQSFNNSLWTRTGSNKGRSEDPELTDIGLVQAKLLAEFLRDGDPKDNHPKERGRSGFGITHLYSSMMVRSVNTGSMIANALDLPLIAWEDLHERGGIYRDDAETGEKICLPGKNREYFSTNYPELVLPESFPEAGWWNFRPYEQADACMLRARRFLEGLLERHAGRDDRVAAVSHGGFYNDFLRTLLNLQVRKGIWFSIYNVGITRIDFQEDMIELVYQNRVDYLPGELVT
jgi:2,3-bisphosphoglycerate-dependent phosphoglycerate mutase